MQRPRSWTEPKPKWQKKLNVVHFPERVPCPYCKPDAPTYPTNLSLSRHVLQKHNFANSPLQAAKRLEGWPDT